MQEQGADARRRWDDRPGALPSLTFARYLTTSPELPEIMRFLVGLLSWPVGACGAQLICPHPDSLVVCERFEQPIAGTASVPRPDDVEREIVEAVRATEDSRPVLRTAPEEAHRTPIAAWPLGIAGSHSRVLVIVLAEPMDPVQFAERTIGLPEALGVYLAGSSACLGLPHLVAPRTAAQVNLTARQVRILTLMRDGFTMSQIASRIGFSESTVRMESLEIYRELAVHDRANALTVAQQLDILPTADDVRA